MNIKTCIPALSAALLLASCGNCDDPWPSEASKQIAITTQIAGMTRVATATDGSQRFEDGDQISVYAWTGDASVAPTADARVVDNAINTLSGGAWTAEPQMLWANVTDAHYFIGVHPAIERGKGLDNNLADVPYQLDVNDQAASDLLVAVNTSGATALDGTVPLAFTHAMAKVVVNLTFRNQWAATPTVSTASVENAAIRASVNLLAKTVAPVEATRQKMELPAATANTRYASIIIPQGQVSRVAVAIDGKDYVYQHSEDIRFEAGKVTTINLIVGRDRVELGSVTIAQWTDGQTIDGGEAAEQ